MILVLNKYIYDIYILGTVCCSEYRLYVINDQGFSFVLYTDAVQVQYINFIVTIKKKEE